MYRKYCSSACLRIGWREGRRGEGWERGGEGRGGRGEVREGGERRERGVKGEGREGREGGRGESVKGEGRGKERNETEEKGHVVATPVSTTTD